MVANAKKGIINAYSSNPASGSFVTPKTRVCTQSAAVSWSDCPPGPVAVTALTTSQLRSCGNLLASVTLARIRLWTVVPALRFEISYVNFRAAASYRPGPETKVSPSGKISMTVTISNFTLLVLVTATSYSTSSPKEYAVSLLVKFSTKRLTLVGYRTFLFTTIWFGGHSTVEPYWLVQEVPSSAKTGGTPKATSERIKVIASVKIDFIRYRKL